MKRLLQIFFLFGCSLPILCQEIPPNTEQQLENQTDVAQAEIEDDSHLLQLEQYRKDPIDLNEAEVDELRQLGLITDLQIQNLIAYRRLIGKLIDIHELQALPGWDIYTIKKVLPYVKIGPAVPVAMETARRLRGADQTILLRVSQILERSAGFDQATGGAKYLGSPQRILLRYRYSYRNLLQYGLIADKDAGEQFFRGRQKKGFDFYSLHFFVRKLGSVQALAIGDFTVNFGQGLTQWQSLAFKKSAEVMSVKRQSATLQPYSSSGEFNFNRGIGLTIKKHQLELTGFVSSRNLSANFVADTVGNDDFISSFLTSGYHRTESENEDRNNLQQTSFGANITYRSRQWHVGLNGVYYRFSKSVQKRDEPYNLYAISGNDWSNFSIDYSYTRKNFHFFGETAMDKNLSMAFIHGLLVSVDPSVDVSVVQRTISKSYQAVNGNAFTENTFPTNETGIYIGVAFRPSSSWRLDAYADFFRFPWLKYLVDAPSHGTDYLFQITYVPNKQIEVYTKFRIEAKQSNQTSNNTTTNFLVTIPRQNWRVNLSYKLSPAVTLRSRIEMIWYDHKGPNKETGFLSYVDGIYKPMMSRLSGAIRFQYFETGGYNSRIYAYENDVLYGYSIPPFFDKGFRHYLTLNYDLTKNLSCWLRFAQSIYPEKESIGADLDKIPGNKRTEVKVQLRWTF